MTLDNLIDLIEAHKVDEVINWLNKGGDPNMGVTEDQPLIVEVLYEIQEQPNNPNLLKLLEAFINKGATLNFPEKDRDIPLIEALLAPCTQSVELLLKNGANPNIIAYKDEYPKYTPLVLAVENDDIGSVKLLAECTSKELLHFIGGHMVYTALGNAFRKLNFPMIEVLLKNGANPYFPEWDYANYPSIHLIPDDITPKQKEKLCKLVKELSWFKEEQDSSI